MKPISIILLALALASVSCGHPDEFAGRVSEVIDGDSIVIDGIGRVRMADIDSYQLPEQQGILSRDFTSYMLLDRTVHLDLDDLGSTCPSGCTIAVVYMEFFNGTINPVPFNRMLVDSGHAVLHNRTNNEFDPDSWWQPE